MSYVSLYREFRPSTFEGLVGQEHIKQTLVHALIRQQFAHAYLFTGPRGTGKTSAAKLLAKAINCLNVGENGEPCNSCNCCKAANENSNTDIIEIDAASNNGVEEIRNIREQVNFAPTIGKFKVFIIDECHMLSVGAFNALLKTLEEPPSHVIFILATTEPHKVLATIISRCQRLDFRRIGTQVIIDRLKFVAQERKISISENAMKMIALTAQGGMRDALSLLDQSVAYASGSISSEDVTTIIGKTSTSFIGEVISLIKKGDLFSLIDRVDEIFNNGKEPEYFMADLIGYYRDILIYKATQNEIHLTTALYDEQFQNLTQVLTPNEVQPILNQLLECQSSLKWTRQSKTVIEVTLIKLVELSSTIEDFVNVKVSQTLPKDEKVEEVPATATIPTVADLVEPTIATAVEEVPTTIPTVTDLVEPTIATAVEEVAATIPTVTDLVEPTIATAVEAAATAPISTVAELTLEADEEEVVVSTVENTKPNVRELINSQVLPNATKTLLSYIQERFEGIKNEVKDNMIVYRLLSESAVVLCSSQVMVVKFATEAQVNISYSGNNKKLIEEAIENFIGQELTVAFTHQSEWESIKQEYIKKMSVTK